MKTTWLGQGGFLFEANEIRLLIDPYLSDCVEQQEGLTRLMPPPLGIERLQPTHILCTHAHLDHLDPVAIPALAEQYPAAPILGPKSVVQKCAELGVNAERLQQFGVGMRLTLGALRLCAVPAYHSDPASIGLVLSDEKRSVYLSADTLYNETLADTVLDAVEGPLSWALLCINGRLGNMSSDEAVQMIAQLQPQYAAPMHYGLFAENTADPAPFVKAVQGLGVEGVTMTPGESFSL